MKILMEINFFPFTSSSKESNISFEFNFINYLLNLILARFKKATSKRQPKTISKAW